MRFPRAVQCVFVTCLSLAAGSALEAQAWEGPAAVGLRVTDEDGQPIAEARIVARISDADDLGPPTLTTDAGGRAVISGLREGEWFIEVSHPTYMLYAAYIDLRAGKKPVVGFSSQVNTATSWKPMTVKFQKATADLSRGRATKRAESKPPKVVRESPPPSQPEPPKVVRPEPEPPKVVRPESQALPAAEEPAEVVETKSDEPIETTPQAATPATLPEPAPQVEVEEPAAETQPVEEMPTEEVPTPIEPAAPPVAEAVEEPQEAAGEETPTRTDPPATESPAEAAPEEPSSQPPKEAAEPVPTAQTAPVAPPATEPAAETLVEAEAPAPTAPTMIEPMPEEESAAPATIESASAEPEPAAPEVVEPEVVEPEPVEPEVVEPEVVEPEALEPEAVEPEAVEPAVAETAAAASPEPAEAPAAEPSTEPAAATERVTSPPAPMPEPAEPAPSATNVRLPRFLRSAAAGTCQECEAGEWAVAAEQEAARAGDIASERECSAEYLSGVAEAAQRLADASGSRLENYTGPVLTALFRLDEGEPKTTLQDLLGSATDPQSNCQMAGVVLPPTTQFSGYVLEAWDSLGGRACRAKYDCAVGQARWLDAPQVIEGAERTVVYTIFKNRSSRRERRLRMTIYFRPDSEDWTPRAR